MSITADQIPGYRAGTWKIDPTHSEVGFSIRHLAISKVRGKFEAFEATFVTGENPLDTQVTASAEVASINTNQKDRDDHLRSGEFFATDDHPQITFGSTGVRNSEGQFYVDGDFTMRGVTRPVTFTFEFGGFGEDAYGNYKAGFQATTVVKRADFGLSWNAALDKGGVVLGDDVTINIEAEAQLQ
jgi:polyisoprenoid-binding protein YceI